ncbi:hypothetical protein U9M48_039241 [Paspalum notatum var. saurae]|uniref:ATP-dependent DNA helicase n=1 Tax=Paspalum notatum var. saurae TaxID=547442 RepID=A0AAQ3UIJ5_PASNO
MTKRLAIEAFDNSLRDIMDHLRLPFRGKIVVFGAKTVVFGGDFRQVPVVCKGMRAQILAASLRKSIHNHLKLANRKYVKFELHRFEKDTVYTKQLCGYDRYEDDWSFPGGSKWFTIVLTPRPMIYITTTHWSSKYIDP